MLQLISQVTENSKCPYRRPEQEDLGGGGQLGVNDDAAGLVHLRFDQGSQQYLAEAQLCEDRGKGDSRCTE